MDTLRGSFGPLDELDLDAFIVEDDDDTAVEDAVDHAPPPEIGADERRMQVRAYNFWASLLDDRNFPSVEDLDPQNLPDFGPNSVLLDFSEGIEDPLIGFIGDELARECHSSDAAELTRLSDVPPRSLLSRITDHYMQILANQSPIGFEAEFVNATGATVLYRGILLPFSSDDESIDFIYGVINWKTMADAKTADELLLEIDQALENPFGPAEGVERAPDLADWADGPSALSISAEVRPSFNLSGQQGNEVPASLSEIPVGVSYFDSEDAAEDPGELHADDTTEAVAPAAEAMGLADWLAAARAMAQEARSNEERTRAALYEAVGRAWDFAIAAAAEPEEFAELLEDAGIAVQERAPMTPVVKLVFGMDYDKTRLTEYATVLAFAQRNGIACGTLGDFLAQAEGGLKGVVAEERAWRRAQSGSAPLPARKGPRKAIAKKLRAIAPCSFADVDGAGEEFALVMIRRTAEGNVVVLGEVPEDASLIEKAARKLVG